MLDRCEIIKAINSDRVLTAEEESDCFYYIREKEDKELKDMFIVKNQGLVQKFMRPYAINKEELEDLFQEGMIGIMMAVDKFDLEQGNKFSTYALWWVRHELIRYKQNHSRMIRLPVHMSKTCRKVSKALKSYETDGIHPTEEMLSEKTGLPVEKVNECMMHLNARTITSLNVMVGPSGAEENELQEFIKDEKTENEYESIEREFDIEHYIAQIKRAADAPKEQFWKLSEKEWDIICLRYGIGQERGLTLEEIAKKYDVTRERIRQIELKALKKLKIYARKHLQGYQYQ